MGSDDPRIGRIEVSLAAEIKESAEFRGEMRQFMRGVSPHIEAVSAKAGAAKAALDTHMADPEAHPALTLAQREKLDGKVLGWMGVIGGLSGVIGAAVHKLLGAHGAH